MVGFDIVIIFFIVFILFRGRVLYKIDLMNSLLIIVFLCGIMIEFV